MKYKKIKLNGRYQAIRQCYDINKLDNCPLVYRDDLCLHCCVVLHEHTAGLGIREDCPLEDVTDEEYEYLISHGRKK